MRELRDQRHHRRDNRHRPLRRFSAQAPIVGPGTQAVSLSLIKRFTIKERFRAEVGMQVANAFNHANYAPPNSSGDRGFRLRPTHGDAKRGRRRTAAAPVDRTHHVLRLQLCPDFGSRSCSSGSRAFPRLKRPTTASFVRSPKSSLNKTTTSNAFSRPWRQEIPPKANPQSF